MRTLGADPQSLTDAALGAAHGDAVVIVSDSSTVNLRFARSTLTTDGDTRQRTVTAVAVVDGAVGVVSRSGVRHPQAAAELMATAEHVAEGNPPAEDAAPLVDGPQDDDYDSPPEFTEMAVFDAFVAGLREAFEAARAGDRGVYGFASHEITTTYLATSGGARRRHVQPTGTLDLTARAADGGASAWAGRASDDFADVDVRAVWAEASRRLDWAARRIELPPGRYETLLPPSAVADLLAYLYWSMSARSAAEGRTALSRPGGGTRVGERLSSLPLQLTSDPFRPGLRCLPFEVALASGEMSSVFDNGLSVQRTDWIRDGQLDRLVATRHSAAQTGLPVSPMVDNLVLESSQPGPDLDAMVAATERGLLLTCLWYIREVDPETLLLTGLTRDGVYLVEHGEVVGVVNNFRFNESPLSLLGRAGDLGPTERTLPREFQEFLPRAAAPPLRVPDFNMSSVSLAR
jgi:predicted Zn-dependent protease